MIHCKALHQEMIWAEKYWSRSQLDVERHAKSHRKEIFKVLRVSSDFQLHGVTVCFDSGEMDSSEEVKESVQLLIVLPEVRRLQQRYTPLVMFFLCAIAPLCFSRFLYSHLTISSHAEIMPTNGHTFQQESLRIDQPQSKLDKVESTNVRVQEPSKAKRSVSLRV